MKQSQHNSQPQTQIDEFLRQGVPHTVRLRVPADSDVVLDDAVYGTVRFSPRDVDDQVLLKVGVWAAIIKIIIIIFTIFY